MADQVTVKQTESKYKAHPSGMRVALCVDTIDFGECVSDFPGSPKSLGQKIGLVFRTGEINPMTGECIDIVAEYAAYMTPKAKLRALLEGWRGKPYTDEEAKAGVPLNKLVGKYAFLNILNKTSGKGNTYAIVASAGPVPKEMPLPTLPPYARPDFITDRKKKYAEDAAKFRAEIGIDEHGNPLGGHEEASDEPDGSFRGEDDLPF